MDFTFQKLHQAAEEARAECRQVEDELEKAVYAAASSEREYRVRRAAIFKTAQAAGEKLTVPEKEAIVDEQSADARKLRDETEGMRMLATEKIRNRRQELSMLQSLAAAYRAEAEVSGRYGGESVA